SSQAGALLARHAHSCFRRGEGASSSARLPVFAGVEFRRRDRAAAAALLRARRQVHRPHPAAANPLTGRPTVTNSLASARVLLTGGTGFIGSHLARRLVHEGAAVYLLVRPDSRLDRLTDVAERLRLLHGDLRDRNAVQQALREARP